MDDSSSKSIDAPQCNCIERIGDETADISNIEANDDAACLQALPEDVLLSILLLCGPTDVDDSLKLVSRRFHNATSLSTTLWKEFCILTGKAVDAQFADAETSSDFDALSSPRVIPGEDETAIIDDASRSTAENVDANFYRRYYFRCPCVPVDFSTIREALHHCPRKPQNLAALGDEATFYSSIGTVVLMPGVYDDRISIGGEPWTVGQAFNKGIAVRAAFPTIGATICGRQSEPTAKDQPCISISTCDEETLGGVQKGISVRLSHLRILHSSAGADIWGGNAAVSIEGPRAQVVIDSCILQSDSGRGLVVSNQAVTEVYRTSIVDCAATGFYLGDWGSRARISGCNIVRNGFGSKRLRLPSSSADGEEEGNILDQIAAHSAMLEQQGQPNEFEVVPPGHSGVYIESSMCWIDDSLLAGNCLTGLSVVRGGFVSLSASDITENGHSTPILIEDAHDVHDATTLQGISIRGGVVEGPIKNNYTSLQGNDGKKKMFKGGVVREGASFDSSF